MNCVYITVTTPGTAARSGLEPLSSLPIVHPFSPWTGLPVALCTGCWGLFDLRMVQYQYSRTMQLKIVLFRLAWLECKTKSVALPLSS